MLSRFLQIMQTQNEDVFMAQSQDNTIRKSSSMATAFMKAVCFSRGWIEEVNKTTQHMSSRILIIKGSHEDPMQFKAIVNSIFACQKLKINVDSLIFSQPEVKPDGKIELSHTSSLINQASLLTNGTTLEIQD